MKAIIKQGLNKYNFLADHTQSAVLLFIRVVIGWSFFKAGLGKFNNMENSLGWFKTLDFPFPLSLLGAELNWYIAASTELVGGLLLAVGLASRLISLPLAFTMFIAFITADMEALKGFYTFSDLSKFINSSPFPYLLGCLVVLAFGPGKASLDNLLVKYACKSCGEDSSSS